ncbi:MAG: DUF1360 domain-containing protein [Bacteroidales bacterium]|nr:DUF1360 domain-containing protein [Bacteroidales bacterium]
MVPNIKSSAQQRSWNFIATVFYAVFVVLLGYILNKKGIKIEDIKLWDLAILSLATYRLTRILVFDKIFKLVRDFIKSRSRLYVFQVIKEIITCPWCAGVWVALVVVILYYLVPFGNIFIYLMVISGIASFFVVTVNFIGLSTEEKQHIVKDLKEDSDYTKP